MSKNYPVNFYIRGDTDPKEVKRLLNVIAGELGYTAERGPTAGQGNAGAMLLAIANRELAVIPAAVFDGLNRPCLARQTQP